MKKESNKKKIKKIIPPIVSIVVCISMLGGYGIYRQNLTKQGIIIENIITSRQLVLNNPMANSESAKKLKKMVDSKEEVTSLSKKINEKELYTLIKEVKKELEYETTEGIISLKKSLQTENEKLEKLSKSSYTSSEKIKYLTNQSEMATVFIEQEDLNGLSIVLDGLSKTIDSTSKQISKKETEKKEKEEEYKKALATAVKNETFPSLGILRGSLPNRGGVIAMDILYDSPAYHADFPTADSDWSDSSVIVGIDGKKVESAVIGDNNIDDIFKTILLGSTVEVEFKDGSTKEVYLDLPIKKVDLDKYKKLKNPGKKTDSDINFGLKGIYNGEKNNNKELGMEITSIDKKGSAWASDLVVGDSICRIDGYYVGSETEIERVMSNYYEGDSVYVDYVTAEGELQTTTVELNKTKD